MVHAAANNSTGTSLHTEKVDQLNEIAYKERNHNPALAFQSAEEALSLSEKVNYVKGKGDSLANLGFYYLQLTEHEKSLELLMKALEVHEQINNEQGIANTLYNLAVLQIRFANFNQAIEALNRCILMREKINDKPGLAACYFQMTYIHDMFNHEEEAIEFADKGIELRKELNDRIGIAAVYNLLGRIYTKKKDYAAAREILDKAVNLRTPQDEIRGYFATVFSQVELEIACGNYKEAGELALHGLEIALREKEWFGVMRFNLANGKIAMQMGECDKAREYYMETLRVAEERKFKSIHYEVCQHLSELSYQTGNYKEALEYYKKYHELKEDVLSAQSGSQLKGIRLMNQIESSKREAELERVKNVDLKNAFKEIEEKNKEILDSIKYASRIQRALLPSEFYIEKKMKGS